MKQLSRERIKRFQEKISLFSQENGRHQLPWRTQQSPYHVLVSEIMLQQTQVERVIPLFHAFLKKAPTLQKLSRLPQKELLLLWQGLGYNTRALRLQKAAQQIIAKHQGVIPKEKDALLELPGIGPYTASAIRVFAYNLPDLVLETNIRRVFLHEFFKKEKNVSDSEIIPLLEKTLPKNNARSWYEALMDYGSTLPKLLKSNPNTQSKHYTKQSSFSGSDRELRGKIVRLSLAGKKVAWHILDESPERVRKILTALRKEGFKI